MAGDAEIIEAVLRGDLDRYAELVHRYQLGAWKLAYSFVGNFEDAKELSQNGFIKAYRHLARFRREAKFSTWLYRILMNECKDFLKKKTQTPAQVSISLGTDGEGNSLFEVADPAGDPRRTLENQELAKQLAHAIAKLSLHQHRAFILHHLQGLPIEEIAQIMNCQAGTVKSHLFRASENLRALLKPLVGAQVQI